jgi:hypothetical protein
MNNEKDEERTRGLGKQLILLWTGGYCSHYKYYFGSVRWFLLLSSSLVLLEELMESAISLRLCPLRSSTFRLFIIIVVVVSCRNNYYTV